jgi:hypothetical protein
MHSSNQLLRSQVDSTPTPVGFLGGAFLTHFTPQWTPNQYQSENDGWKAVYAILIPEQFIFLMDVGLHNAGWTFARNNRVLELHEVIGSRAKFCWAHELDRIEIVSPTLGPNHQQLADKIYADETDRADGEKLVALLDDLFNLVGNRQYTDLDLLMKSLDVSRAAPEYLVGVLRATSQIIAQLSYWESFLGAVTTELTVRKLNPASVLVGLV